MLALGRASIVNNKTRNSLRSLCVSSEQIEIVNLDSGFSGIYHNDIQPDSGALPFSQGQADGS